MDNEEHKMVGWTTDNGEGYPLINKGLHDMKPLCHRLISHIVHCPLSIVHCPLSIVHCPLLPLRLGSAL